MSPVSLTDDQVAAIALPAIDAALALLPPVMDSLHARVLLVAIGLQESRFIHRRQKGNGPARSFWQFERGTEASRGGVWGVYLHPASREMLRALCVAREVDFEPRAIWSAMEHDDVLAAGVARLLIYTDPHMLPAIEDSDGAWELYARRCWRPGKPHPHTWDENHAQAVRVITAAVS
jgi:hypothetical protein